MQADMEAMGKEYEKNNSHRKGSRVESKTENRKI